MDELLDALESSKLDQKKLEEFKEYFMSACDGHSTENFVQKFFLGDK